MVISKSLETPRLILRTMNAADASDRYLSWMRDPIVNQYLENRFSVPEGVQDLITFIEHINATPDSILFGIYLREDLCHIGNIKIGPIVTRHARSEIGYLIGDRKSWGKGYASEAIREICQYGFKELGLLKITAGVYETNTSSAKTLIKAGFVHEATMPSHVVCEGRRIGSMMFGLDRID